MRWFRPRSKHYARKMRKKLMNKIEQENVELIGKAGELGVLTIEEIRAIRRERNKALSQQENVSTPDGLK